MSNHSSSGISQRCRSSDVAKVLTPPLGFKGPDRSGVVASSDLRVLDTTECITGAH
ncbi:hypothetical protein [Synechococcus sp. A15-28]|uniref:hypothetical protein n=1 Tax=Synechococcus sp. A15-28 TaxID=1050638 RepID=UPI0025711F9D|nr:hypothetical protein [Synechococcus sp. A15-28]